MASDWISSHRTIKDVLSVCMWYNVLCICMYFLPDDEQEERQTKRSQDLTERKEFVETTIQFSGRAPEPYLAKDQLVRDLVWQMKCKAEKKEDDRIRRLNEEKNRLKIVNEE